MGLQKRRKVDLDGDLWRQMKASAALRDLTVSAWLEKAALNQLELERQARTDEVVCTSSSDH